MRALLVELRWQATGFWTLLMYPPLAAFWDLSCYLSNQSSSLFLHFIHAPVPVGGCVRLLLPGYFRKLVCHLCVWLSPFAFQLMLQNTIPMCSAQYEYMFNTTRVPGVETGRVFSRAAFSTLLLLYFSLGHFVQLFRIGNNLTPVN